LGAYVMNMEGPVPESREGGESAEEDEEEGGLSAPPRGRLSTAEEASIAQAGPSGSGTVDAQAVPIHGRTRSPTPPRVLYRSTTGKGVAFTEQDVTYMVNYLAYRRSQVEELNMVQFWKDIAEKAPHHSRASWMKYWRRHRHEIEGENELHIPATPTGPPAKRARYGHEDDVLLAKYFVQKPEGTSDVIFQAFAKTHPHHPWKGWQEHHRIHKAEIDHLIKELENGNEI